MSHGSATIKDIARVLGISKSTVSRALSEHSDVNSETRKRIREVAQKLDYQPNVLALNLKQQRTRTIGVIIPETENRFFARATSGIQRVANLAGYNVMICQSDESYITERNNLRSLIASHVDGILISIASETDRADHFDLLLQKNIPVVFFDRICEDLDTSHVFSDNYEIGFDGTSHLVDQGCKRIAIIAGPQHLYNSKNRLKGYLDALKNHGLPVNENYIVQSQFRGGNVEEYTRHLLGLAERPDAVFSINDYAAVEMMHILKKNGTRIPGEIAVLGINNDLIGRYVEPSLSTIDLSVYEMASAAAEILLNRIKDHEYPFQKKPIKGHLIIRDSSHRLS